MSDRIQLASQAPAAIQAMMGLESYLGSTDIPLNLKELIKLRASMINGCAYCIEMHAEVAMKMQESPQRLLALAAWRESPLFDGRERAVLALTDEVTLIAGQGVTEHTYRQAQQLLGDALLAQCLMQIITINAWNRVAVATQMEHEHR
ncbi:carboxymuconolactone decarboxylase family protein [Aeromonas rivuli]|jgi:AhpD family alkylhydroperoxidase|uniref:carboxymuconolactone decarboxylase family protein n=1 Tax=Aeromonas TaxID=642 RepID=UPI0005AADA65|nr:MULTISPECIES: carboxymuconolactone decarboxylase family protein [Aeromonas]MCS3454508.1 AhpD family alkylhydroperoxidase [Aeromonas sp. BIGb0405]MCS3459436.1 AhpD family alkylhydroperoxidase [Aeromonas sp. BIGb0445]UBO75267.1 carboxymuconolactone decarboxylase family protein [Aeromonas rivuli]